MSSFSVKDFGAHGTGTHKETAILQEALDAVSESGGGTVVFPAGTYLTGALFLTEGVDVCLEEGAVILGSPDIEDYPYGPTRFEGRTCPWPAALINAKGLNDFAMYGEGVIDGGGAPYWKKFWDERQVAVDKGRPFSNRDVPRPRLVFIEDCSSVSVLGLTLRNSGFWNLHLFQCEQVLVQGLTISAPHEGATRAASSDAIDIDVCTNVIIRDCDFDTDDDCVCIKGGKGPDAHQMNLPTENVLVENCRFGFGHGVLTVGSEACIARNITVRGCELDGENNLVRFKFRDDTVQLFENIVFEDITIRQGGWLFDIKSWISRQDEVMASGKPSTIRGLTVRNVTAHNMQSPGIIQAVGPHTVIENIRLENIEFTSSGDGSAAPSRFDAQEIQDGAQAGVFRVEGVTNMSVVNMTIDGKAFDYSQG